MLSVVYAVIVRISFLGLLIPVSYLLPTPTCFLFVYVFGESPVTATRDFVFVGLS